MTTDLATQLLELRRAILTMGAVVDARVERVVEAFSQSDFNAAREIRHGDREVDSMEIDIEQICLEVLALFQPVARDLRFVLAVLRINGELERIADLAKGIAKRVLRLDSLTGAQVPPMLGQMAAVARGMLTDALNALSDSDVELARQIRRRDREVDDYQRQILDWVQQEIASQAANSETTVGILAVAGKLERIADIATNIAEDVIFLVEGKVVRHSRLDQD